MSNSKIGSNADGVNVEPSVIAAQLKQALECRDRRALVDVIRRLITGRVALGPRWKSMAAVLKDVGELELAWEAMNLYAFEAGGRPEIRFELAAVSAQMGFVQRAYDLLEGIPSTVPTPADHAYTRGTLLMNLGRDREAREALRHAVHLNPQSGQAWLALALAGRVDPADSSAIIEARHGMLNAPLLERASHCYAMGKVCHERGQFTKAFEFFDRGAAWVRDLRPYNAEADKRSAELCVNGWTPDTVHAVRPKPTIHASSSAISPIFVTGLPRSGTTLVEQILTSHSEVDDGDELRLMRIVLGDIGGSSWGHVRAWCDTFGDTSALADLYRHLLSQRFPAARRVVDKSLGASRYLGVVLTLFPDSPVLWLRRNPWDCAWSAYRTWFLRGLDWSWSLASIAEHFLLEDRLFRFWTEKFPERILVVDYEQLVREPEVQIGRINTFCRLKLEPAQLQPHRSKRVVTTASVSQVREPINTGAIDSANPYRRWMTDFTDRYSRV